MKRLVLLVVVALGMSATSFAGEKVEGKDWKVDVNVAKLSKYLNLDARQMEEVANISDNSGKLLFVPYTKDFGRITQFWGNDLATVLYATFCSDMLSSHSFSKQR